MIFFIVSMALYMGLLIPTYFVLWKEPPWWRTWAAWFFLLYMVLSLIIAVVRLSEHHYPIAALYFLATLYMARCWYRWPHRLHWRNGESARVRDH